VAAVVLLDLSILPTSFVVPDSIDILSITIHHPLTFRTVLTWCALSSRRFLPAPECGQSPSFAVPDSIDILSITIHHPLPFWTVLTWCALSSRRFLPAPECGQSTASKQLQRVGVMCKFCAWPQPFVVVCQHRQRQRQTYRDIDRQTDRHRRTNRQDQCDMRVGFRWFIVFIFLLCLRHSICVTCV
jgi:hypothetical protein